MRAHEFIREDATDPGDRVVRVVPNIDNLSVDKSGAVSINHNLDPTSLRNTSHWTQNSVVGSHEMGDWDKAGYAIIANPREIKAPLIGARPEDTYYALDKNKQLNIGNPTILAPKDAPVPKGVNVIRYEGDRNTAIQQHFANQNLPYYGQTGRNNLPGVDQTTYNQLGQEFANKYHNQGPATLDSHMNTIHSRAEGVSAIQDQLNQAKATGQKYVTQDNQTTVPVWQDAQNRIVRMRDDIKNYVKDNPAAAKYEKEHWSKVINNLKQSAADAEQLRSADKHFGPGSFKNLPGPKPLSPPPPPPPRPSGGGGSSSVPVRGGFVGSGGPVSTGAGNLMHQMNPFKLN